MTRLHRSLKIIAITLFILSILAACEIILVNEILLSHGIHVIFNTKGKSMGNTP